MQRCTITRDITRRQDGWMQHLPVVTWMEGRFRQAKTHPSSHGWQGFIIHYDSHVCATPLWSSIQTVRHLHIYGLKIAATSLCLCFIMGHGLVGYVSGLWFLGLERKQKPEVAGNQEGPDCKRTHFLIQNKIILKITFFLVFCLRFVFLNAVLY